MATTSTSWVGRSPTLAIRNRKEVYEDETGILYIHVVDDRIFAETILYGPHSLSTYKHWLRVLRTFERSLMDRGIDRYWAVVDSYEKYRWCEFLGFESADEMLGDTIEFMVKDLHNGH